MSMNILKPALLCLLLLPLQSLAAEAPYVPPAAVLAELKVLDETYAILDSAAERIWPGWDNYREFPFLLTFENGLRVLIGHPVPPETFERLAGVRVGDRDVFIDTRNLVPLPMSEPLICGGGVSFFGYVEDEPVWTVSITLRRFAEMREGPKLVQRTEQRILVYIHELFHCFQEDHLPIEHGNIRYNPDTNYALYSEIEGLALDRAFHETDDHLAKEYLRDFITARRLKRRSMTDDQQQRESSVDLKEGTAVYSEVRALEVLQDGFTSHLTSGEDPWYRGFEDAGELQQEIYVDYFRRSRSNPYDCMGKCYTYGCFQALMLQRLYPGWQEAFTEQARFLDQELAWRLGMTAGTKTDRKRRFRTLYGLRDIRARVREAIRDRDRAFKRVSAREGRVFVIDFKSVGQFVARLVDGSPTSYELGLTTVYPQGVGRLKLDEIELDAPRCPALIDQLYYLKIVDTRNVNGDEPYQLVHEGQEDGQIFNNVLLTTNLFTLRAPRVRIRERGGRTKISILSRAAAGEEIAAPLPHP